MRKAFFILLFLLAGCSAAASVRSDFDACRADPVCVQRMEDSRLAATRATQAATSDGFIPTLVGYFASLFVGVIGGHKLSKKQV